MARKEIIVWTDDLTGETVEDVIREIVCVEGVAYELDLGPESHRRYLELIEPYRSAGRRIGRTSSNPGGGIVRPIQSAASAVARTVTDKEQNRAIREWWRKYGSAIGLGQVVERGRIPESVQEAFQTHGGRAPKSEATEPEAVEDVQPGREPRKPESIGAQVRLEKPRKSATKLTRVTSPDFTEPGPVEAAPSKPRKRTATAAPEAVAEAAQPASTPRRRRSATG